MKMIALYLPQYHSIPENDKWWGKDYTEWDSVKRGTKLIDSQYQPRQPLNNNYYNLLDINIIKWQVKLAKEFGIYGFCVYHYWFNGKLLLEKPMENFLNHPEIKFPFCFCWANEDWSNIWSGDLNNIKILISNDYNNKKDWVNHFYYFLPFFKDKRYILDENKPVLVIYNPLLISKMKEIKECWDTLAKENGFDGICLIYQGSKFFALEDNRKDLFDYGFQYFPGLLEEIEKNKFKLRKEILIHNVGTEIRKFLGNDILHREIKENKPNENNVRKIDNYDFLWEKILSMEPNKENIIPGAFTDWDNTPRRMYNGKIIIGSNPQKFKKYLSAQIERAKNIYKKDCIFIFAWNEWSEGGYLEPDEKYKYGYLEAVREALEENNEMPEYNMDYRKKFFEI